ncbi:hypothetical protein B0A49_07725 [Cryomyces minteri]|uniref:Enoyl reductase (ER) domain-containing protein n=1 Tax=Cryomyces minteri TaxID=331657 RepID=A0A4U0X6L4_9PEZI|nr:hypothetical protein B0A49_07725 [Cryomyces minteri]
MRALVYKGASASPVIALEDRPQPTLQLPTDCIVKMHRTTICGTDLHILHGNVPTCPPGRVLGHEGIGYVEEAGEGVKRFKKGDKVLISCITSCATCIPSRKGMSSHCKTGGWTLGHTNDGTQPEYVRIPHADSSLHPAPKAPEGDKDGKGLVTLSDILPTGLECGVLNGKVQPGCTVAIVGAGPVGLAALMTAQLYSPRTIVMIDRDESRLEVAKKMGATHTVVAGGDDVQKKAMALTDDGEGFDTVIEAVGYPATFELCQDLVAVGGTIANVGVHGSKVDLHLEKLWGHNITITTRLVDAAATPMLLKLYEARKLQTSSLVTHDFAFGDMVKAYDVFGKAAEHGALKLNIEM